MEEAQVRQRGKKLFEPPEAAAALSVCFDVVGESDRGAVLIGAATVDNYMRQLFEKTSASRMTAKEVKKLLGYPGPLSSLAAKADVALATGLIGRNVHQSIHILRGIRNKVAHSPETFNLKDHHGRLREMYDLGSGVALSVNRIAMESFLDIACNTVLEAETMKEYVNKGLIDKQKLIEHLTGSPDALERMSEKANRFEMGIAISILCALIAWCWHGAKGDANGPSNPTPA